MQYANKIVAFLKANAIGFLVGCAVIGGPAFFAYKQASVDRTESVRIEQYGSLEEEERNFYQLLDTFTYSLATEGKVSSEQRQNLSSSLVKQYQSVGTLSSILNQNDAGSLREYQTALNEVKREVQTANEISDLDALAVALVQMQLKVRSAKPALQAALGLSSETETRAQP